MVKTPVVMVNFKAYDEVVGERDLALARACGEVAEETGASIVVCPQAVDLGLVVREVDTPVYAQHVDAVAPGGKTGHVTPDSVKGVGAVGTLINHSEMRQKIADIQWSVNRCREIGLETVVCTNNVPVSLACAMLEPDFVAVEPPELIGGDISVTSADPKIVRDTAEAIKERAPKVMVLTGAGVKNGQDVKAALDLGTDGVLLASGVVKAKDPKTVLLDLVSKI